MFGPVPCRLPGGIKTCILRPVARVFTSSDRMAKSKFEYVRNFETDDPCLKNCYVVVRLDGRNFHKGAGGVSAAQVFAPSPSLPSTLLYFLPSSTLLYLPPSSTLLYLSTLLYFLPSSTKLMTHVASQFSSSYVFYWRDYFRDQPLLYPPGFNGRVVLYPSNRNLRDYLSWRQADCIHTHLNTHTLLSPNTLSCRTLAADKNEILFSEFDISYNNEPLVHRKGTTLIWEKVRSQAVSLMRRVSAHHCDVIGDEFWEEHPNILEDDC
uniref:Probable tRNA(His) guanylyltransferase n=1 Tax=Hucho hucho TaxID=62062 RepID=A0A4W5LUB6_9TELE